MTQHENIANNMRLKAIPGYNNMYAVADDGSIYSIPRIIVKSNGVMVRISGGVIKPQKSKDGYLRVSLHRNGQRKTCLVHRLVAETFIQKSPGKNAVNHRNGNKEDNSVQNLEWVDHAENMQHASVNGLIKSNFGQQNGNATAVVDISTGEYWGSITEAATAYGVNPGTFKSRLSRNYYPTLQRVVPPENTLGKTRRAKKRGSLPRNAS